jgi:hypothetical protein
MGQPRPANWAIKAEPVAKVKTLQIIGRKPAGQQNGHGQQ